MSIKKILKATVITSVALLTLSSAINLPANNVSARHIRTHRVRHHISRAKIRRIKARNLRHRRKATRKRRTREIHRVSARNKRIHARKSRHRNKIRRQHKSIAQPVTNQSQAIKTQLAKDLFNTRKKMYDQEEIMDDGIYETKKLDHIALIRANQIADKKYDSYDNNSQPYVDYLLPTIPWSENFDTTYQNDPGTNNPKQIANFFNKQFVNYKGNVVSNDFENSTASPKQHMSSIDDNTGIGVTYRPGRGYYAEELFVQQ